MVILQTTSASAAAQLLAAILLILSPGSAFAQGDVDFESSNLPIVVVETDGQAIPDEPKIPARMRIIDNGAGARNAVADPPRAYDGWIGIERRGNSSQTLFPKKQYAVETREEDGTNRNVELFGMPEENDWILHAPYSDKTMLRNVLAYELARRTRRYASRTRFCEVVLNGQYQGIYVWMEKIKGDDGRVDLADLDPDEVSGDDVTGGYIIKLDKYSGTEVGGWVSNHPPRDNPSGTVFYQYHDPKPSDIVPEQEAYIQDVIASFEDVMASDAYDDPDRGYAQYIDVGSFVDFMLVNEVTKNVDGYRLSTYLHKDRDSRGGLLHMGPVWDFNLGFGNADYFAGARTDGWQIDYRYPASDAWHIPFWWFRLRKDASFRARTDARWQELRRGPWHTDSIMQFIDAQAALLAEAGVRNEQAWPTLGRYVWPNAFVGATYEDELDYLKRWLRDRLAWMDGTLATWTEAGPAATTRLSPAYPQPARTRAAFHLVLDRPQHVRVDIFDMMGRRVAVLHDGWLGAHVRHHFQIDGTALPAGTYLYRARGATFAQTRSVMLVR